MKKKMEEMEMDTKSYIKKMEDYTFMFDKINIRVN